MDTVSILAYIGCGFLFWFFVNYSMKTWYRRNEGTGNEVDLKHPTTGMPLGFGKPVNPDSHMIGKLEEKLKNGEWSDEIHDELT